MLLALHQVLDLSGHVVAQVVETELIVSSECDVAVVYVAAFLRVGLGLVDAAHGQAMELIQRTHPLGVTFGQIVVDGNHMDTFARQCVQKHRQRSHQRLSFTGGHLGDVVADFVAVHDAVEHHTADQLHIVVHHVPCHHVAAGHPAVLVDGLVAVDSDEVLALQGQLAVGLGGRHLDSLVVGEAAGSLLDHGEHLGQRGVKILGVVLEHFFARVIDLLPQGLALVIIQTVDLAAYFGYAVFVFAGVAADIVADHVDTAAKLVMTQRCQLLADGVDLVVQAVPQRTYCAL